MLKILGKQTHAGGRPQHKHGLFQGKWTPTIRSLRVILSGNSTLVAELIGLDVLLEEGRIGDRGCLDGGMVGDRGLAQVSTPTEVPAGGGGVPEVVWPPV